MDKLAMVKQAEVNGVIGGLVDSGYVKLASEEDFNLVCEAVTNAVSDNWDLDEVLSKTAEIMEDVNAIYGEMGIKFDESDSGIEKEAEDAAMDKEAEEAAADTEFLAAYGHLTLLKEAEEIDEDTYRTEAGKLRRSWEATKRGAGKVGGGAKNIAKGAYNYTKAHPVKAVGGATLAAALGYTGYKGAKNWSKIKPWLTDPKFTAWYAGQSAKEKMSEAGGKIKSMFSKKK